MPILFDREYTCLTMATIHSSLIDYRFRLLPPPKVEQLRGKKDYVDIGALSEVDQTYI